MCKKSYYTLLKIQVENKNKKTKINFPARDKKIYRDSISYYDLKYHCYYLPDIKVSLFQY